jgi:hypothetical protein
MYSSAYFKNKAVLCLNNALNKATHPADNIILLGLSAGAEVVLQFLTSKHTVNISKAICIGLFVSHKKTLRTICNELIFLFGEHDFIGIKYGGATTVLAPKVYAPACVKNILNPAGVVKFRIVKGCSHTLIPEINMRPELLLKNIITNE